MKYVKYINSKIGKIQIFEENKEIIELNIGNTIKEDNNSIQKDTELLTKATIQLQEYFIGKRTKFDLPLNLKGTEFMKKTWESIQKIPYGEVKTYKQIAKDIGNEKAVRAVGMANHRNPIPIIIPCHRVIGSNGKLIGYALGIDKKEYLLNLERENKNV